MEPLDITVPTARSAKDIINHLPISEIYNLTVSFASEISFQRRTAILNEAFSHARAQEGIVSLDLSGNELREAPRVTELTHLQELNLSNNQLSTAPVLLGATNLSIIDLSHNEITQPPRLTDLVNLKTIDLSHNRLQEAPDFTGLTHLDGLDLSHNEITQPPRLTDLVNLETIDLSHNRLQEAPDFTGLTHLEEVHLDNNPILTVSSWVNNRENLEITFHNVRHAPDVVSHLPTRQFYNLTISFAREIPVERRTVILNEIVAHRNAQEGIVGLDLSGNALREAPLLTGLTHLQELNLSENELQQMPDVRRLTHLRSINMRLNRLTGPIVLTGLANLEELRLSRNMLTQPPVIIGSPNLWLLSLGNNRFIQEPIIMRSEFPHLQVLDLANDAPSTQSTAMTESTNVSTDLIDISVPEGIAGVAPDSHPFFLAANSVYSLLISQNPLTRKPIVEHKNLVESWRYWQGKIPQEQFDNALCEEEVVTLEPHVASQETVKEFLRLRHVSENDIERLLQQQSTSSVNLRELIEDMRRNS